MCVEKFVWDVDQCKIDCSLDTLATGARVSGSIIECVCNTNYIWNETELQCIADCDNDDYSTGRVDGNPQCTCQSGFVFNTTEAACVLDCDTVEFATGRLDADTCICPDAFLWDEVEFICAIQCDMTYAVGPI